MAIQANKPNNRVFLLLGIILAALAFGGVLFALRQQGGNTTNVVVAKQSIPAGTTLTSDLVTTVSEPASAVPSDHYAVATAVVGKTTTVTVGANDPIVPAFFAAQPLSAPATTTANGTTAPVSLETQITKGYVALAIPANANSPGVNGNSGDLTSAGYYILPGDHIDILVLTNPGTPNASVRFSFQDVPVLRVGDSGTSGAPSVYMVEVPRSQAELLTSLIVTTTGTETPVLVKYVLRPESEWGKVAPDNSSYTPNYEGTNGPLPPSVKDNGVNAAALKSLFGS